jgi:hypothetical protein
MGLIWAAAWFGAGLMLLLVVGAGAADDQLSLPRFAGWGAVGGLLLSGIFVLVAGLGDGAILVLGPVFALSSAASAAGSLALARMAEDRQSLDHGGDDDEPRLAGPRSS